MGTIKIERPSEKQLKQMGVYSWPIWQKEISTFNWHYDDQESCYLLGGKVTVTPEGDKGVTFGAGDFVVFPKGMSCAWQIHQPVKKHYKFG